MLRSFLVLELVIVMALSIYVKFAEERRARVVDRAALMVGVRELVKPGMPGLQPLQPAVVLSIYGKFEGVSRSVVWWVLVRAVMGFGGVNGRASALAAWVCALLVAGSMSPMPGGVGLAVGLLV